MNLEETIYKRQSIRAYKNESLTNDELDDLITFIEKTRALNDNIIWSYDIVSSDKIRTLLNWRAPHYLLLFSQQKENYKQNLGFIFQQVDLYLQSKGIGSCWLGMISPNKKYRIIDETQKFIIGLSFGKPEKELYRKNLGEFNRKNMSQITDREDEKLKAIQYAPSATNSQPWYITHNTDDSYNIYRQKLGLIRRKTLGRWNELDIGIGLAHLYIENRDTFNYSINQDHLELKNYIYEGRFEI